jgi:hypothetical protein
MLQRAWKVLDRWSLLSRAEARAMSTIFIACTLELATRDQTIQLLGIPCIRKFSSSPMT